MIFAYLTAAAVLGFWAGKEARLTQQERRQSL